MESTSSLFKKYLGLFHKQPDMSKTEHEIVHSGWMTKSPPDRKLQRKLQGPWKMFRAKWKKRYFVLCKPSSSLPGQYELNYFSDAQCLKKKGTIDLDQCEQIIESLDSEEFPYLLAIKTICKGKERTYYLATATEDDMSKWVSNLCSVCGLKQEDSPTDIPEVKQVPTQNGKTPVVSASSINPHTTTRTSMTRIPIVSQPSKTIPVSNLSSTLATSDPYIPLQDCSTGTRTDRQSPVDRRQSVDSVPDELAPPPPLKTGHHSPSPRNSNEVFDDLYSVPPPSKQTHISFDPFYLVPPSQGQRHSSDSDHQDFTYDVPPAPRRGSPCTPRSSSSGCTDSTLSVTPQDLPTYDTPPSRTTVIGSSPVPPSRPPRPMTTASYPQNDYQNLPTTRSMASVDLNAIIPTPCKNDRQLAMSSYDVPRSNMAVNTRESNINVVPEAPKPCSLNKGNKHSYINAGVGFVQTGDEMYLAMDRGDQVEATYTNMNASPPIPAPRPPETLPNNDLYVSPPSSRAVPRHPPGVVPRPIPPTTEETYAIWSNTRTKSFKRHQNGTTSSGNGRPSVPHKSVKLPHRDGDISSDDEGLAHLHRVCGVQSIPPPPPAEDKELKYLDLALEESTDKDSVHVSLPSNNLADSTPTEYREIDFVKTQALINTKKWGDDQRQNEKLKLENQQKLEKMETADKKSDKDRK